MPKLAPTARVVNESPDLGESSFKGALPDAKPSPDRTNSSNSAKFEAALNAGATLEKTEALILKPLGTTPPRALICASF